MTAQPAQPERHYQLRRIGITEADAQAIEHLWGTPAIEWIATEAAVLLGGWGHDSLNSLDTIWHELDPDTAHRYLSHRFTPHQAFLLHQHTQKKRDDFVFDDDTIDRLLDSTLDRRLLASAILVADSPVEARSFIDWCNQPGDGIETIENLVVTLPIQVDFCDCQ